MYIASSDVKVLWFPRLVSRSLKHVLAAHIHMRIFYCLLSLLMNECVGSRRSMHVCMMETYLTCWYMHMTRFVFPTVFCLSCIAVDEISILFQATTYSHFIFQISVSLLITCCSYPWPQLLMLPTETRGYWLDISGGCGALLVSLERMPPSLCAAASGNCSDEVIPLSSTETRGYCR
jgi:hypothetical protein